MCSRGICLNDQFLILLCSGRGAEYCDQFICLSVRPFICVSVCPRAHPLNRWTDLYEFCADFLWP